MCLPTISEGWEEQRPPAPCSVSFRRPVPGHHRPPGKCGIASPHPFGRRHETHADRQTARGRAMSKVGREVRKKSGRTDDSILYCQMDLKRDVVLEARRFLANCSLRPRQNKGGAGSGHHNPRPLVHMTWLQMVSQNTADILTSSGKTWEPPSPDTDLFSSPATRRASIRFFPGSPATSAERRPRLACLATDSGGWRSTGGQWAGPPQPPSKWHV